LELFTLVIFALIINGLFALIPANIAAKKGHSAGGYWALGFFLSFVLALVLALVIEDRKNPRYLTAREIHVVENGLSKTLQCPACAEWIKAEAKICKHCREDVSDIFQRKLEHEHRLLISAQEEAEAREIQKQQKLDKEFQEAEIRAEARRQEIKGFFLSRAGKATIAGLIAISVVVVGLSMYSSWDRERVIAERKASYLKTGNDLMKKYADWSIALSSCKVPKGSSISFTGSSLDFKVAYLDRYLDSAGVTEWGWDDETYNFIRCMRNAVVPGTMKPDDTHQYDFSNLYYKISNSDGSEDILKVLKSSDGDRINPFDGLETVAKPGQIYKISLKKDKDYDQAIKHWFNYLYEDGEQGVVTGYPF
jgi:hypothetical protein